MAGLRRGWALLADTQNLPAAGGKKFTPSHNAFRLAGKNHKHESQRTKPRIYVFPLPQKPLAQWCPSFCRPSRETASARPSDALLSRGKMNDRN